MMIPLLLAMIQAAASQVVPAHSAARSDDIIVTAKPFAETERVLAACIARHCPPTEDIAASVSHAENQLVAGDYYGARATLLAARGRNARYASQYPVEVAGLLRANARVAGFTGQPDVSRINQIDSLDALKRGLPPGDVQILAQRLEVGDAFAKQGELEAAVEVYRRVTRQARAKNIKVVEGLAMLREAVLYGGVASVLPSYQGVADEARKRIERTTDPDLQPFRDAAAELKMRLSGKAATSAPAVIPADAATAVPHLIYQPVIDEDQLRGASITARSGNGVTIEWVDVAFRITPNGTVDDVEVMRRSTPCDDKWVAVATKALQARRYTGYAADRVPPGIDRTERYSFVYDVVTDLNSHIRARSAIGRIDMLDLTPPATTTAVGTGARPNG